MLTSLKRIQNVLFCRMDAAHYLDDDLYGRIGNDLLPVIGKKRIISQLPGSFFKISHKDPGNLHLASKLCCHLFFLVFQYFIYTCSNSAQPQKGCFYDSFFHRSPPFCILTVHSVLPKIRCAVCKNTDGSAAPLIVWQKQGFVKHESLENRHCSVQTCSFFFTSSSN